MKKGICFLIFMMLASVLAYPDEQQNENTTCEDNKYYRVYFGADVFFMPTRRFHYEDFLFDKGYLHRVRRYYEINIIGAGLKFGYDFIKPNHFYHGGEGLVSGIKEFGTIRTFSKEYQKEKYRKSILLANIEERLGYTFADHFSSKFTISPFGGLGYYFSGKKYWFNWLYATIGFRANQRFTNRLDIGFNAKWISSIDSRGRWFNLFWGYEIELPITYHLKKSKNWDIQIQPYALLLHAGNVDSLYGLRILAGYNF